MAQVLNKIKNVRFASWLFPFCLTGLAIISFGLLIPHLGFYWDDWAQILVGKIYHIQGYWDYFANDRPLSAWTHSVFYPILGNKPINWQIFTLFLRLLTSLLAYWMLLNLWPKAKRQAAFISTLFLVYPVFTQQATSVAYHQHWLQHALFFASLGFMVLSLRKPQKFVLFCLLAILFQILQLSITEYFVGLELIRPVLLWILVSENDSSNSSWKKLVATGKNCLPYFAVLLIYVTWRLFFLKFPTGEDFNRPDILYQLVAQPVATIQYLFQIASLDTLYIIISSWAHLLNIQNFENPQRFTQISWILGFLTTVSLSFFFIRFEPHKPVDNDHSIENNSANKSRWLKQAFLLGFLSLILGPLPVWLIDYQVILDQHSNRFAIPAMIGASILFITFLEWISPKLKQKAILLSIFIGLALALHLQAANDFRWLWTDQTRFFWQLYWRAPMIEPGTAIISEDELFPDQGLFSTSSAINLLYPQENTGDGLSYWVYTLRPKFTYLTEKPDVIPFHTKFRTLSFSGETPDSILIYKNFEKGNCLWVLTPDDSNEPELSDLTIEWLSLSNTDRILDQTQDSYPPTDIFGDEPEHTWCYYFQKADLARQNGDWENIVALGNEAQDHGYHPQKSSSNTPHEWIPFIQAYAITDDFESARDITLSIAEKNEKYHPQLCLVWKDLQQSSENPSLEDTASEIISLLKCEQYSTP